MELLQKIEELKEKYQDPIEAQQINAWEEEAKRLLIVEHVAGSEAVKYLVKQLESEIEKMNELLLTMPSFSLSDASRDRLLDKKALYKQVIAYFDVAGAKKALEAQIDAN